MTADPGPLLSQEFSTIWNIMGAKYRFTTSGPMDLRQQTDMLADTTQRRLSTGADCSLKNDMRHPGRTLQRMD